MVEDEQDMKEVKADAVQSSIEFRLWRNIAKANSVFL